MGSYKFFESYLLYKGTLYNVEGWDRDYIGDCWESQKIMEDLLYSEIPLVINKKISEKDLIEIILEAQDFKDIVKRLADRKIISYVDNDLCINAIYTNDCILSLQIYHQNKKSIKKIERVCNLLQINKDTANFLNDKRIMVICSEFILLNNDEKYDVIFFDEIEDIILSLNGKTQFIFKDGTQSEAKMTRNLSSAKPIIRYF